MLKLIAVLFDLIDRNPVFEEKCYQLSFPYFLRYLQSLNLQYELMLNGIDDSQYIQSNTRLKSIGRMSRLLKPTSLERIHLPKGGFLVSGSVYYQFIDSDRTTSRINYRDMAFLLPVKGEYIFSLDSIVLEFKNNILGLDSRANLCFNKIAIHSLSNQSDYKANHENGELCREKQEIPHKFSFNVKLRLNTDGRLYGRGR